MAYDSLEEESTSFYSFLEKNASLFDFILRYPEGKEKITGYSYEPWHIRFIQSVEVAKYIMNNNLCLEEYKEEEKQYLKK